MRDLKNEKRMSDIKGKIMEDFRFLVENRGVKTVLLYGSWKKGTQTKKSDIDICIVVPELKSVRQQTSFLRSIWQKIDANKYDIRLFEELPLYIKINVINNSKIIFTKSAPELSYYFYKYRKLWNDQSINWFEKK